MYILRGSRGTVIIMSVLLIIALAVAMVPINSGDVYADSVVRESEPNDKSVDANTIAIGDTVTGRGSGEIGSEGDDDYFYFNVPSTGELSYTFTFPETKSFGSAYRVYLYNKDGKQIELQYIDMKDFNSEFDHIYLKPGNYFMLVSARDYDDSWNKIDYTFKLSHRPCVSEQEYNGDTRNANPIKFNKTYNASMYYAYDKDYYTFTLTKKTPVTVAVNSDDNFDYVSIVNSKYKTIAKKKYIAKKDNYLYKTLPKGKYYIKVLDSYAETTNRPYTIRLAKKSLLNVNAVKTSSKKIYTGKAHKPAIKVSANGKKLKNKTNYTYSYKNNKKIGTAKIIIKGKGAYTGTITKTFKIVPNKTSITELKSKSQSLTVKWKKVKGPTNYQIQYRQKGKSWISETVSSNIKSATFTDLVIGKKYEVRIRSYKTVSGTKFYSSWSKKQEVVVK